MALVVLSASCRGDSDRSGVGTRTFTVADVHPVGSSESMSRVVDLSVDSGGGVWVLNSVAPYFIELDGDGRVAAAYGRRGGGPEEFPMPAGFLVGGLDGATWIFDFIRHAFVRVAGPEAPWTEVDIPREQVPAGTVRGGMSLMSSTVRTARLGRELLFPWTSGTLASGVSSFHQALLQADIAALDPATGVVRPVLSLADAVSDPSADFVATDGGFPLWYRLWAVCGDQIRVYDRVLNELRGFDGSGREAAPVALPPPPFSEVTPEQFARAVYLLRSAEVTGGVGNRVTQEDSLRIVRRLGEGLTGSPRQLAAYLPRYVDFRCADDGTMWLQPVDLEAGGLQGAATWLRVARDGAVRSVRFPDRFDPLRFQGGRVWGVQRDDFDVATVAWIGLDRV